jgi:hypothetical protein
MSYKLFVQTSGRIARIVPASSNRMVSETLFGELSSEDALRNRENLPEAVREILRDKGIEDADTYTITVPDNLRSTGYVADVPESPLDVAEVEEANEPKSEPEKVVVEATKEPEKTKQ